MFGALTPRMIDYEEHMIMASALDPQRASCFEVVNEQFMAEPGLQKISYSRILDRTARYKIVVNIEDALSSSALTAIER